jgi:hypothetical protein
VVSAILEAMEWTQVGPPKYGVLASPLDPGGRVGDDDAVAKHLGERIGDAGFVGGGLVEEEDDYIGMDGAEATLISDVALDGIVDGEASRTCAPGVRARGAGG